MSAGVGVKSRSLHTQRQASRKDRRRGQQAQCVDDVLAVGRRIELDATNFSHLPENIQHAILKLHARALVRGMPSARATGRRT